MYRADAPADMAMPIDGARDASSDAFTLAMCPASYTITVTGIDSRYRLITGAALIKAQHADCKDDVPGATHLAAFQTAGETAGVAAAVTSSPIRMFVGAVQNGGGGLAANWFVVTGEPLPSGLWNSMEPNDADGIENGSEQFGLIDPMTDKLHDEDSVTTNGAVCECDGRAIDPTVEIVITSAP